MAVYTVYEPPQHMADDTVDTDRFAFVRDGFSFWAFLLGALWMLWHRMWLVLVGYVVVLGALDVVMRASGASAFVTGFVSALIALLIGLEAGTLRRFTLDRRGWTYAGVVSGDDVEDAERRFFDAWTRQAATRTAARPSAPPPAAPPPVPPARMPHAPDVVGLFPEPGASR